MIFGLKAKLEKGIRWGDLKLVQSLVSSFPKTPQAAFFANKNKIDIVITDLRMPHTDGIDVMKAIHQYKKTIVTQRI